MIYAFFIYFGFCHNILPSLLLHLFGETAVSIKCSLFDTAVAIYPGHRAYPICSILLHFNRVKCGIVFQILYYRLCCPMRSKWRTKIRFIWGRSGTNRIRVARHQQRTRWRLWCNAHPNASFGNVRKFETTRADPCKWMRTVHTIATPNQCRDAASRTRMVSQRALRHRNGFSSNLRPQKWN